MTPQSDGLESQRPAVPALVTGIQSKTKTKQQWISPGRNLAESYQQWGSWWGGADVRLAGARAWTRAWLPTCASTTGSCLRLPTSLRTSRTTQGAPRPLIAQAAARYLQHTKAFILAHTMGSFSHIYFYLTFQSSVKSLWVKGSET